MAGQSIWLEVIIMPTVREAGDFVFTQTSLSSFTICGNGMALSK
jgi:hypothetical protein